MSVSDRTTPEILAAAEELARETQQLAKSIQDTLASAEDRFLKANDAALDEIEDMQKADQKTIERLTALDKQIEAGTNQES